MTMIERRVKRSPWRAEALFYQLDTSRQRSRLQAMVLADRDGLCIAGSGDTDLCDELSAHMPMVCEAAGSFEGSVGSPGVRREVLMQRFTAGGEDFYVCAVGGDADERLFEVSRSSGGAARILAN